jgi:hypothetical protein
MNNNLFNGHSTFSEVLYYNDRSLLFEEQKSPISPVRSSIKNDTSFDPSPKNNQFRESNLSSNNL